ncbi:MAG: phosphotransferase [Actinomycetota bacterium]
MAEKRHIPQSVEELDAAWFDSNLGSATGGSRITAVDHERIGEGIGFVGDLYRCRLTWEPSAPDQPRSVVVKLPSSVRENRALGEGLMAYEREIIVYREHAADVGLPMPAHVHSDMDKNPAPWLGEVIRWLLDHLPMRGVQFMIDRLLKIPEKAMRRFLLVMEDVDDARPAEQFDGGSLEDAHAALRVLARFHAHHWMRTDLRDKEPLVWPLNRTPKVFQASYRRNRPEFVDRFGDIIGPSLVDRLDEVDANLLDLAEGLTSAPWTVLHGDYRLDNVLFRENGEIVVVDYQLMLWGRAGWDVAYFITTALSPEHKDEEDSLLRTYHDELAAAGVADYPWDELVADCTLTKEMLAHRMVGSGDVINTEVEGRDETFIDLMVRRVGGWVDA